jgi:hypothetical protein
MNRMRFEDNSNPLRDKILELLNNSITSSSEDLDALLQCASQIRNRMIVLQVAKECGYSLSRFITNDKLELYYDIKKGRHDFGYISKGWDEPGFRVGDIIKVPKANIAVLKDKAYGLLKYCAGQGVVLTLKEEPDGVDVEMDSVIYLDGFNKKVFEQVLHYLNVCVEKAQLLIE